MSFSYNPYKHIDLIQHESGGWGILCDSCGGVSYLFTLNSTIKEIFAMQSSHILNSHKRTPEDFVNWSTE